MGLLLKELIETKNILGYGVEINDIKIEKCIEKGVPVIKQDIDRGMNPGNHQLDIVVNDRVGNKKNHTVSFTCK